MTAQAQERGGTGTKSAERVLRVLELIGSSPAGLTAAEVGAALDLYPSTTYRLLKTLQQQDYIDAQQGSRRYVLGRMVDSLGRAVRHQLVTTPEVRATLRALHDSAHAAAYLTVFRGDDIAVAHIEDSPEHPRIGQLHVGFSEGSNTTAFGKLMLAAKDDAGLVRFLERRSPRALTMQSITGLEALREELDEVRAQQLAVEVEEYMPKLACIAAPVKSRAGRTIGAVSVSVSARDFEARAPDLERAVRGGAWLVSSGAERV